MKAKVRITGARETALALRTLGRQSTQDKVLRQALRPGAREIVKAARKAAPKRTGALRKSIAVGVRRMTGGAKLQVGHRRDDPQGRWRISHILEYGSRYQAAQPYMRAAFRAKSQQAVQLFGQKIWQLIAVQATRQASRVPRRRRRR